VEALVPTTLQQGDEGFPVGITPKVIERVSLNFWPYFFSPKVVTTASSDAVRQNA
jgi:hypothetical protein